MLDINLERMRAHRKNIDRYRRLLETRLSKLERTYIERRVSEEQASIKRILRETFPDSVYALQPCVQGRRKSFQMGALLHPAGAFARPMDVVDDCDLTPYEKLAILSSWVADVCAVQGTNRLLQDSVVSFEDILDAPTAGGVGNKGDCRSRQRPWPSSAADLFAVFFR